jgi:hypothetical protein
MTKIEARQISKELDAYMNFRARREGVEWSLTPKFLEQQIRAGIGKFFGVTFANGKLVADEQQPEMFAEWNRSTVAS